MIFVSKSTHFTTMRFGSGSVRVRCFWFGFGFGSAEPKNPGSVAHYFLVIVDKFKVT